MIELTRVLKQIEKELTLAQQSQDTTIMYQKLAAIKALCELTEQTFTPMPQEQYQTHNIDMMPSQAITAMMGQPQQDTVTVKDNLLDF